MLMPDRRLLLAALSASLLPPAARAVAAEAVNAPKTHYVLGRRAISASPG